MKPKQYAPYSISKKTEQCANTIWGETRRVWIFLLLMLILLFIGCESLGRVFDVPIKELIENPRQYEKRNVTISGYVAEVYSIIVLKAYVISDDTGQIIVVTERILPKQGSKVRIKGTLAEAFSFGTKTVTVFKEQN